MTIYTIGFIFTLVFIEKDNEVWWKEFLTALAWPVTLALGAREVYDKIMKEDGK